MTGPVMTQPDIAAIAKGLSKAQREALPKAKLFWLRWRPYGALTFLKSRCANAMFVWVGPLEIGWRMPWLEHSARALHPELFAVRAHLQENPA